MRYTVREAHEKGLLKEGVRVRTNGDGQGCNDGYREGTLTLMVEGALKNPKFAVIEAIESGGARLNKEGRKRYGRKRGWQVRLSNDTAWIELIDNKKDSPKETPMAKPIMAGTESAARAYIGRRVRVYEGSRHFKAYGHNGIGTIENVHEDYGGVFLATVRFDNGLLEPNFRITSETFTSDLRLTRKPGSGSAGKGFHEEDSRKDRPAIEGTDDKPMLQKITAAIKRRLNPSYHTLYRAGFINGDLEFTELGNRALMTVLADREDVLEPLTKEADAHIREVEKAEKARK